MATPAARLSTRVAAGREPATPEGGLVGPNGALLTHKGGANPTQGSCGYGVQRFTHQVAEAVADGGVQTNSVALASALIDLGIYNYSKL